MQAILLRRIVQPPGRPSLGPPAIDTVNSSDPTIAASATREIVVTTSAYGADLVRARGQAAFAPIAAAGGACGLEIRRELLTEREFAALPALGEAIRAAGLFAVYSAPVELVAADGALNKAAVQQVFEEAAALTPLRFIKLPLGHFKNVPDGWSSFLAAAPGRVVIENDQTTHGGTVAPLHEFFTAARENELPIGMTFDIGNWSWVGAGEEAAVAAESLAPFVEYIHLKTAARSADGKGLVAVPVADEDPEWKALVARFRPGLPLGIEFPLAGDDLAAVTRTHVRRLESVAAS